MENQCHVSAQVSIVILVNENIYFPVGLELDKIPCNVSSYVNAYLWDLLPITYILHSCAPRWWLK